MNDLLMQARRTRTRPPGNLSPVLLNYALRTHLLLVPGMLTRSGRRLILKLPRWSAHEATAKSALKRMRKLLPQL